MQNLPQFNGFFLIFLNKEENHSEDVFDFFKSKKGKKKAREGKEKSNQNFS